MRIAFITELPFHGKVSPNYPDMRTEFAWMLALDADHYNIGVLQSVENYDHVFIIFPKGEVYLNSVGSKLIEKRNPTSNLLQFNLINEIKSKNKKVHFIQEGPHWLWNDYDIVDQINFYNLIASCDSIFAHNEHDALYYRGMFLGKEVNVIPTLMIEDHISEITSKKEDKAIIGGNFARWYGGFESYIVANKFQVPVYAQTSHAKRDGEELVENLTHLPRLSWIDWMKELSTFKYAVHLMPTIAAGTFSLNCAYFGIPCIGNIEVDTQLSCHPRLSVNCNNIEEAVNLAIELRENKQFYDSCSSEAIENYKKYYSIDIWKEKMNKILK